MKEGTYYSRNKKKVLKKRKERHKRTYVKIENYKGKNHHFWKGDDVGYKQLHHWIRTHKIVSEYCEECNKNKPYDIANISGEYKRDVNDFEWLCRSCHMKSNGRIHNLKQYKDCGVE